MALPVDDGHHAHLIWAKRMLAEDRSLAEKFGEIVRAPRFPMCWISDTAEGEDERMDGLVLARHETPGTEQAHPVPRSWVSAALDGKVMPVLRALGVEEGRIVLLGTGGAAGLNGDRSRQLFQDNGVMLLCHGAGAPRSKADGTVYNQHETGCTRHPLQIRVVALHLKEVDALARWLASGIQCTCRM
jgi:hypothetical protein